MTHVDDFQYESFDDRRFDHHLNTRVTQIKPNNKTVNTSTGDSIGYDILVLATGSDAVLPTHTPGHNANGVFVYRTISDLELLIDYASKRKGETAVTVGGGLLGLEAAKAMIDLQEFERVALVDRNKWVLARQLDGDAGSLVTRKIKDLGLEVLHQKRVAVVNTDGGNNVTGITFEDGEHISCGCICFAVSYLRFPICVSGRLLIVLTRLESEQETNSVVVLVSIAPKEEAS